MLGTLRKAEYAELMILFFIQAAAMGIWNLAVVLPQIIAPAFTTLVLQHLGPALGAQSPRVAFGLALGETLVGIAWLWRLSRCAIGE